MRGTSWARLGAAAAVSLFAVTLVGGAAYASTTPGCNPTGRAICISITDEDHVTHSTATVKRYTRYQVTVSNGGTSVLTNGSAVVSLLDVLRDPETDEETEIATAGRFLAAPSGCTMNDSFTSFTCPLGNLAAMTSGPTWTVYARTSTNTAAAAMRLVAEATFNEKSRDSEGPAAQSDKFTLKETTELEPRADFSQSFVFFDPALPGEGSTTLETEAIGATGARGQSTTFAVPTLAGSSQGLATLDELSAGDDGYVCPPGGGPCFGQIVRTSTPAGIYSANTPATIVTTMLLSFVPAGVTERSLRVFHGTWFTTPCVLDSEGKFVTLPCRTVSFDRRAGIATIVARDTHQGNWGFS